MRTPEDYYRQLAKRYRDIGNPRLEALALKHAERERKEKLRRKRIAQQEIRL